jgi:Do/DeqQ family serine protease
MLGTLAQFARQVRRPAIAAVATAAMVLPMLSAPAAARGPDAISDVAEKVIDAVVNISTSQKVESRSTPMPQLPNDPQLDELFRDFFNRRGQQGDQNPQRGPRRVNSLGSGFIIDAAGIVVTNNHVISEADEITVILNDRREFEAKVVGKDPRSDLAVLQLQNLADPLPALDLADSDDLEVGDMVLAIGNPFGVGQTVTSGIISALARTTVGITDFRSFIQTDAAVNPGNSGGALIASDGRLVGINTAIYSRDGSNNGIGFAIPANMVRTVVISILKDGRAVRAWLGASGKTITADLARSLALPRPMGVLVERVAAGSPAARGGLQPGDIVRSVNGRDVQDLEELRYMIATLPVGGTARLGLQRDSKEQAIQISLQAPPNTPARQETALSGQQPFSGATVANLNPALAEELGREFEEPGVIILSLSANSIAARLGLRPGDIVMAINDTATKSVADLQGALSPAAGGWSVVLNRAGQTLKFQVGG